MNIYFIVTIVFAAYLVLAWIIGLLLRLQGSRFWLLWGCLALIGMAAAAIFLWFHRKLRREQTGLQKSQSVTPDDIKGILQQAEHKLGQSRRSGSLDSFPVVFVLGEPGSAKTSTIVHSGLNPELLAGQVYQDSDIVSTSAINVWFARDTVFVEAGGRIALDQRLWGQLLHYTRPKRFSAAVGQGQQAARAVLLCFECERLASAQPSAKSLRSRLKEMAESLGAPFPVYVIFTKLDRIKNFSDFVQNFTSEESSQPLGATFARTTGDGVFGEKESSRLSKAFDQIIYSLAEKRLDYLRRDSSEEKLPGIYEFPRELKRLRNLAVQFLVEVTRPAQLSATPFLRGFYLSGVRSIIKNEAISLAAASQTRSALPSEATRIMNAYERMTMQAPAAQRAVQSQKVPEWCFLPYLFTEIIMRDRAAFSSSRQSAHVHRLRRWILAGVSAIALLYCVTLLISFFNNRALELEARNNAANLAAGSSSVPEVATREQLQQLEQMRHLLIRLGNYETDGPPLGYRFGLYAGNRVQNEAGRIYFAHFRRLLLAPTQEAILAKLRALPPRPLPADNYGDSYDSLKAYLMTTQRPDMSTVSFLAPVLLDRWARGHNVSPEQMALAQSQFEFYAGRLQHRNIYSADADAPAITRARDYLINFEQEERIYQRLLADAGKNNGNVDFNRMFPGSAAIVTESHVVPGAFTREAFKYVQEALRNPALFFGGEDWVLDKKSDNVSGGQLMQALKARYEAQYREHWLEFVRAARVTRYASLQDASGKLRAHAANTSPLLQLLFLVAQNTSVDSPAINGEFQPAQFVMAGATKEKLISAGNQNYAGSLQSLQGSIVALLQNSTPDAAAVNPVIQAVTDGMRVVGQSSQQGFQINNQTHLPIQQLMEAPIRQVLDIIPDPDKGRLNAAGRKLCDQFETIAIKYPFNTSATAEATLEDLKFFQPGSGALWSAYQNSFASVLVRQGNQFVVNPSAKARVTPQFLQFMNRAAIFSDAIFTKSGDQTTPHMVYTLHQPAMKGINQSNLSIDGKTLSGTGGAAQQFVWPGNPPQGVNLTVNFNGNSLSQQQSGLWGSFRFFHDAQWTSNGPQWQFDRNGRPVRLLDGSPVEVHFEVDGSAAQLFHREFFDGMRCFATVVH